MRRTKMKRPRDIHNDRLQLDLVQTKAGDYKLSLKIKQVTADNIRQVIDRLEEFHTWAIRKGLK
jgi:hypothetical protein